MIFLELKRKFGHNPRGEFASRVFSATKLSNTNLRNADIFEPSRGFALRALSLSGQLKRWCLFSFLHQV
jgi:hypothetical protein